jgi:hypothetical protein
MNKRLILIFWMKPIRLHDLVLENEKNSIDSISCLIIPRIKSQNKKLIRWFTQPLKSDMKKFSSSISSSSDDEGKRFYAAHEEKNYYMQHLFEIQMI